MDLQFLFFELGPALKFIFRLSYIPQAEDFKELTPDQYQAFYEKASEEVVADLNNKRLLAFIPDDPKIYRRVLDILGEELYLISEEQLHIFLKASDFIDHFVEISGKENLDTVPKKLGYLATLLPDVFSKGTPYGFQSAAGNIKE